LSTQRRETIQEFKKENGKTRKRDRDWKALFSPTNPTRKREDEDKQDGKKTQQYTKENSPKAVSINVSNR